MNNDISHTMSSFPANWIFQPSNSPSGGLMKSFMAPHLGGRGVDQVLEVSQGVFQKS